MPDDSSAVVEYGVFNDPEVWEPLFAGPDGLHSSLRELLLERPLYASELLAEAARHARLTNDERAQSGQLDRVGAVVVKTRTVTRTAWSPVPLDDVARELGEF